MRNDVYTLTGLLAYWQGVGKDMARIWQGYGKYMARGWQVYGKLNQGFGLGKFLATIV